MEINANTEVRAGLETNHIVDFSDRLYKIILAIIGLIAVYIVGQMVYDFKLLPQNYPREISVSGEGKAYAKPDIATVSFGVISEAPKSQDAVNQNNQKMQKVVEEIKKIGVEEKDIRTTFYNLYPIYGYERVLPMGAVEGRAVMPMYYPAGNNKITGYRLEQQIEVKIRNFDKINEILDSATLNGANTVGSLQFTVDDMEKVKAEAREKAIAAAKEKAEVLFSQTGLRIDKLINIYEDSFGGCGGGVCPYGLGVGGATMEKDANIAPQIEPGQTEIAANVTLVYRVR